MRKYIVLILFFLSFAKLTTAQFYFNRDINIPVSNGAPLLLPWAGGLNFPLFSEIDFNNDGLKDLFVFDRGDNRVSTYLNNGNSGTDCWDYAPQYENAFPSMNGWAFLYDYNCDGKPDLLTVGFRNNSITQYVNDSPIGGLHFTLVDSMILMQGGAGGAANIFASGLLMANFNDIDNDGDMDIIGQQFTCVGAFAYYKNYSMEHYGVCDSLNDYQLETNAWGKFALRSGVYPNVAIGFYNINCFSSGQPSYDMSLAAPMDDTFANIFTIDIDGDGDKDALIGDSQTRNSLLAINGGTSTMAIMTNQDTAFPSYDVPVDLQSFTQHSYVDADNDSVRDLIVANDEYENNKGCYYYKNIGSDSSPVFSFVQNNFLQDQMIDVGEAAAPVLFDYDNDGLLDLVIGNKSKTINQTLYSVSLTLYRNVGTASSPAFEFVTDDFAGMAAYNLRGKISPAFGDMDGDGDKDLLLGNNDGTILYFKNNLGTFTLSTANFMGIDVGSASSVQIFDVDFDGKLDLVVGEQNGLLNYFQNVGSVNAPFFTVAPTASPFGSINLAVNPSVDGYTSAYVFRQNNDTKMLVTQMHGDVLLYGNIDGNVSGTFTLLDTVVKKYLGNRYGFLNTVSGGDLNNDGKEDMIVGLFGGGVQVFYQSIINNTVDQTIRNAVEIFPNPVKDKFVIRVNSFSSNLEYTLVDLQGRKISNGKIVDGYSIVNAESVAGGIYLLHVFSPTFNASIKVVVAK